MIMFWLKHYLKIVALKMANIDATPQILFLRMFIDLFLVSNLLIVDGTQIGWEPQASFSM